MPRQISDRTRKVREIIERIPPDEMNETMPTDVREQLEAAGVAPCNEQDKQTLYAEFSRRRRKLGLLRTQSKQARGGIEDDGIVRVSPEKTVAMKLAGESLSRIIEALNESDVTLPQVLGMLSRTDRPLLEFVAAADLIDLLRLKDIQQQFGWNAVLMMAYSLGMKEKDEERQIA